MQAEIIKAFRNRAESFALKLTAEARHLGFISEKDRIVVTLSVKRESRMGRPQGERLERVTMSHDDWFQIEQVVGDDPLVQGEHVAALIELAKNENKPVSSEKLFKTKTPYGTYRQARKIFNRSLKKAQLPWRLSCISRKRAGSTGDIMVYIAKAVKKY